MSNPGESDIVFDIGGGGFLGSSLAQHKQYKPPTWEADSPSIKKKRSRMGKPEDVARSLAIEADWHIDPRSITPGKELGRGSFGVVRAAVWRHTPVAIKILYQDAQSEDQSLFEQEVAMMATLHHPNIVQFLGYTRTPSLTLVIEYFPEGSLEDYIRKHKSNQKVSLRFCFEMACGLEYLHSRSPSIVIHRGTYYLLSFIHYNSLFLRY
mmetsp:Transcript_20219/g.25063  ORF Transcript_20219/g.25063 Transcript_20219/m.25063 type:complete len:209 (+) Transcript_20219:52-678(+)